jgi:ATP-binding cassette subfamily C protein LapB
MAGGAFAVLVNGKTSAIEKLPPGLRREIMNSLSTVQQAYSPANITAVLDSCFAFLFVGVLYLLSPLIAIIVTFFIVGIFLYAVVSHKMLGNPMGELSQVSVSNNALVGSAIQASDSIRSFNAANFLKNIWGKQQALTDKLRRNVLAQQGVSQSVSVSAASLMTVAVIGLGATYVVAGDMNVGVLIGANILASRALAPISRFAQLSATFTDAQQALLRLEKFVKLPREEAKGTALKKYRGRLELKDLAFMHRGASGPLFESLSLQLPAGSVLVVSGDNGAGKTTMTRLITGLIEPTRGQIFVDGLDLRQVQPEWWRRQVIYMPQEPTFFEGSIRDNLMTLNDSLDESKLLEVIERVGLKRYIDESPQGLETPVTNGGANLARGIRRRMALARGLVSDGMLAVFDEPAEGMDSGGGALVFNIMNELVKSGRTLIICSHNPDVLKARGIVINLNAKPVPEVRFPSPVNPAPRKELQ